MLGWIIGMIAICIAVLLLSIWTTTKGYAYKQTIDPLPEEKEEVQIDQEA